MLYFAYGSNLNHFQMKRRCKDSEFLKKINLFNSALKNEYLLDLAKNQTGVEAFDWNKLSKMDPAKARELVTNAMVKHQWTGYFPKQFGEKVALTQVKLEEGSALLEQAVQFNNPLTGNPYKAGEEVYVTRAATRTYKDPDAKDSEEKPSIYELIKGKYNKAFQAAEGEVAVKNTAGLKAIKSSMTGVPVTLPDGRGKYVVDAQNNIRLVFFTQIRC